MSSTNRAEGLVDSGASIHISGDWSHFDQAAESWVEATDVRLQTAGSALGVARVGQLFVRVTDGQGAKTILRGRALYAPDLHSKGVLLSLSNMTRCKRCYATASPCGDGHATRMNIKIITSDTEQSHELVAIEEGGVYPLHISPLTRREQDTYRPRLVCATANETAYITEDGAPSALPTACPRLDEENSPVCGVCDDAERDSTIEDEMLRAGGYAFVAKPTTSSDPTQDAAVIHGIFAHSSGAAISEAYRLGAIRGDPPGTRRRTTFQRDLAAAECPSCMVSQPRKPRATKAKPKDIKPYDIMHADILDNPALAGENERYSLPLDKFIYNTGAKKLFIAIDERTKYGFAVPMMDGTAEEAARAYCAIDRQARHIMTYVINHNPKLAEEHGFTRERIMTADVAIVRHFHSDQGSNIEALFGVRRPEEWDINPLKRLTQASSSRTVFTIAPTWTHSDPQRPYESGVIERHNRTWKSHATASLAAARIGTIGFLKAYMHAVFTSNLMPTNIHFMQDGAAVQKRSTPHLEMTGEAYDIVRRPLHPFGSLAATYDEKKPGSRKVGLLVGYRPFPDRGYYLSRVKVTPQGERYYTEQAVGPDTVARDRGWLTSSAIRLSNFLELDSEAAVNSEAQGADGGDDSPVAWVQDLPDITPAPAPLGAEDIMQPAGAEESAVGSHSPPVDITLQVDNNNNDGAVSDADTTTDAPSSATLQDDTGDSFITAEDTFNPRIDEATAGDDEVTSPEASSAVHSSSVHTLPRRNTEIHRAANRAADRALSCQLSAQRHLKHNTPGLEFFDATSDHVALAAQARVEDPEIFETLLATYVQSAQASEDVEIFRDENDQPTHLALAIKVAEAGQTRRKESEVPEEEWDAARDKEIRGLLNSGGFEQTFLPKGKRLIKLVEVRKVRQDDSLKVREVAQGFRERFGIDYFNTFSPVVGATAIRLLTSIAATHGLTLWSADVTQAYLNADLEEEIYVAIPKGFNHDPSLGNCFRLKRSLYGLKQSGRNWYKRLVEVLKLCGLEQSKVEPCVFTKFDEQRKPIITLATVVDDILAVAFKEVWTEFIADIKKHIALDEGSIMEATEFNGCRIHRTSEHRYEIGQERFIDDLVRDYCERFGWQPKQKSVELPLTKLHADIVLREPDESEIEPNAAAAAAIKARYLTLLGSLLWLAQQTRPDIAYAVSAAGRRAASPSQRNLQMLEHVLNYVHQSKSKRLVFDCSAHPHRVDLTAFTDSDWASDVETRRSTTGLAVFLAGCPVAWVSRRQPTVSLSTAQAETNAAHTALKEVIYLKDLLTELGYNITMVPMLIDNTTVINRMMANASTSKHKYEGVIQHWLKEMVEDRVVWPFYVDTTLNIADMFTKGYLDREPRRFIRLATMAMGDVFNVERFDELLAARRRCGNPAMALDSSCPSLARFHQERGILTRPDAYKFPISETGGTRSVPSTSRRRVSES